MKKLLTYQGRILTALMLSAVVLFSSVAALAAVDADGIKDVSKTDAAASDQAAGPVTEEQALAAAWEQISGALLGVYSALTQEEAASEPEAFPVYRLSIEPATLRLLNFASESVLKVDLSWIKELGIDIVPTLQKETMPYYDGRYIFDPQDPSLPQVETPVPGLGAVLHVNGKEILTSDLYVDDRVRGAYLTLPELVSGEGFINLEDLYRSMSWSLRDHGFWGNDISMLSRTPDNLKALLPSSELLGMLLESAGEISQYYKPETTKEVTLSAGKASQTCMAYTGSVNARDGISVLLSMMERVSEDEEFRSALIEYINHAYDACYTNMFVQSLLYQSGAGRYVRQLLSEAEEVKIEAAILSGDWKFRQEELNERGSVPVEEASAATEESYEGSYEEETETEDENAYHPEDIQAIPGKAYTWDELWQLPWWDTYSLMRRGIQNGEVILTEQRSLGDALYLVYSAAQEELTDEVNRMYYSMDRDTSVRITTDFSEKGKLAGIAIEPVYQDTSYGCIDLVWPSSDEDMGLALTLSDEDYEVVSVTAAGHLAEEEQSVDVQVTQYGESVFAGNAALTHDQDQDMLSISAQGEGMPPFLLTGSRKLEDQKEIFSLNIEAEEQQAARLDGFVDHSDGNVDFELHIPAYNDEEVVAALKGNFDAQSGDSSFEASVSQSTRYGLSEGIVLGIETDGLKLEGDGSFSGTASVGVKRLNTQDNPIPRGLKLVIGNDRLQIADDSAVYVTLSAIEESEYLSQDELKSRISDMWKTGTENYYSRYMSGRNSFFNNNWNIGYPINRLLDAGMP